MQKDRSKGSYTIKEIARMAGVSAAAVSYVINGKKGVSDETRKKVEDIIHSVNFIPNPNSRRLFYKKSNNIGLILENNTTTLDNLFYLEITKELVHVCEEKGYNLIFTASFQDRNPVKVPNIVKSRDVEGIIYHCDTGNILINELDKYKIPVVFVDSFVPVPNHANVYVDYTEAAYMATMYLIECGHTHLCFLSENSFSSFTLNIFNGFIKAIDEAGISVPINWSFFESADQEKLGAFIEKVMESEVKPTAFFCAADIYAIHAINGLYERGFSVPDDVSVIGIDDIIMSSYIRPALTTVRIDKSQMGVMALDLLLDLIENGRGAVRNLKIPLKLVERKSVKRL